MTVFLMARLMYMFFRNSFKIVNILRTVFVTLPTPRADMNQSQGRLRPSLLL